MAIGERINKPSPKWYRILNRIWGPTENFVIALLLLIGMGENAMTMLVFKLSSSFFRQLLDLILVESQSE